MALIECKNLCVGYDNFKVINNLNFSIDEGAYLCIIGENGTGKSTLLKAMLGLKSPTAGKVEYNNGLKKNDIGYVSQKTEVQKDFPASVMEVVLSGCLSNSIFRPFYSKSEKIAAKEAMKEMKVLDLKNKCFRELSGGQQQRVLLARALCASDKAIFMDEPVTGLDGPMTTAFFEVVKRLNKDKNMTIVMVSHDIHCAVKYATHILHLKDENSFFGKTEDYIHSDLGKSFIGGHKHD